MRYLTLTDELIREMAQQQTDTAIFLDKSARPVAWMVHTFWDQLAPRTEDGSIPKEPEIKFVNIDREQWGAVIGRSESGALNVDNIPAERIDELREVFAPVAGADKNDGDESDSLFDGKRVIVIDEVRSSGDTLAMSTAIMNRAFPGAEEFRGTYWMGRPAKLDPRSGGRVNPELPIWYSDRVSTGRGVADRDASKSRNSNSGRQRAGRYWLSTTFRQGRDEDGLQLRREIEHMSEDLAAHRLLYKPAPGWDRETVAKRIERLDGILAPEYVQLRRESRNDAELMKNYAAFLIEKTSEQ